MKQFRYSVLLVLILINFKAVSCDTPYRMNVGPFFDSSSLVTFWGDFAQEISKLTNCPTNIYPGISFEDHIINSVNKNGDIFIVPTYYVPALQKYGLERIINTNIRTKTYLVTAKKYDPENISSLKNATIHLTSKYTVAFLVMENLLKEKGILDTVTFEFGSSFQVNAMSIIRGNTDAALIFSPIFDSLPDNIKSKFNYTTILESSDTGSIMIKSDAPQKLKDAVYHSKDKINILKWIKSDEDITATYYSNQFEQQVAEILKIHNSTSTPNK